MGGSKLMLLSVAVAFIGIFTPSRVQASAYFRGTPGSFAASDSQLAGGQTLSNWSIELWLKPASLIHGNVFSSFPAEPWKELAVNVGAQGEFGVQVTWPYNYYTVQSEPGTVLAGEWQLLTVIGEGSQLRLYRNGRLAGTGISPGQACFQATHGGGVLGAFVFGLSDFITVPDGNYYEGKMADFRVWTRALTDQEITSHVTKQPDATAPGLANWIPFDETAGNQFRDIVSGLTGTLNNIDLSVDDPSFVPTIPQQPAFLREGLVAYYPFDGNVDDASGNSAHPVGTDLVLVGDRAGESGKAIKFNGSSSLLELPAGKLRLAGSSKASVSLWVKLENTDSTPALFQIRPNVDYIHPPAPLGLALFGMPDGRLIVHTASDSDRNFSTSVILPNRWLHLVLVYDGVASTHQDKVKLFINGVRDKIDQTRPEVIPSAIPASSDWASIGGNHKRSYDAVRWSMLDGELDDVRIYNRTLSEAEVKGLYDYESRPASGTAIATPQVVNGFVVGVTVSYGGSGYTDVPSVTISGGGGSGATATATISNGAVTAINIQNPGSGYTSMPTVVIARVAYPPVISTQPQSVTVNAHDDTTLSIKATGTLPLKYQWSLNGTNIVGATLSILSITNVGPSDLGRYAVVITNADGSVTSSDAVVSMYPYLSSPFNGLVTYWGFTNTLSTRAWGSGPLSYQWYHDGEAVSGATNSMLTLTRVQLTDAGFYSVVVKNAFGSVTNSPSQVVVNPAGVSLGMYPGVTVSGVEGYTYEIQSNTDLTNTNGWVTRAIITLSQPVQLWVDTKSNATSPDNPRRFYRVLPGE